MLLYISLFLLSFLCSSCDHVDSSETNLKNKLISIAKENHLPTLSVKLNSPTVQLDFYYQDKTDNIQHLDRYGIASTTKFLTSLLVLKQIEENKFALNDPIYKFVDSTSFSNMIDFHQITIKHLLNHTSGIPEYTNNPNWINLVINSTPPENYDQKIALINFSDSSFHFGKFAYSNSNYVILEHIIGVVYNGNTQQIFDDYFAFLHCPSTSLKLPSGVNQAFFAQLPDQITNTTDWQENYGYEGGAYSNTSDLSWILRNTFIEKRILSQSSLDYLTEWIDTGQYNVDYGFAQINDYGLGLMKFQFDDRVFVGHAGSSLKYQCFAFIEPTTGVEIILQTNGSGKHYNQAFFIDLLAEIVKEI